MKITDEYIKRRIENGYRVVLNAFHETIILDKKRYDEIVKCKTEEYFTDWKVVR